jgi:hypothetical protein
MDFVRQFCRVSIVLLRIAEQLRRPSAVNQFSAFLEKNSLVQILYVSDEKRKTRKITCDPSASRKTPLLDLYLV